MKMSNLPSGGGGGDDDDAVGAGVHAAWYTIDCHSHHSIS
jgi:hypothetical protein